MKCVQCNTINPDDASFCYRCGVPLSPYAVHGLRYASFWLRATAFGIDAVIVVLVQITLSILSFFFNAAVGGYSYYQYGGLVEFTILFLVPIAYFWITTGVGGWTIGKKAVGIEVVTDGGLKPSFGQIAVRETIGKIISTVFLLLGFLSAMSDPRVQAWHHKLAGTSVVRTAGR